MRVDDVGRLEEVAFTRSPNVGGALVPIFIVMHYTAGWTGESAIRALTGHRKVSAHFVIDRDGTITQLVPCNRQAWHAGPSVHMGYRGLNKYSIGIEFVNIGWLRPQPGSRVVLDPYGYARNPDDLPGEHYDEFMRAPHARVGSGEFIWPLYTDAQLVAGEMVTRALCEAYPIQDVVSHEQIDTRGWKTDPGPAFPLNRYRKMILDDRRDVVKVHVVTASSLNVRGGPGTDFDVVGGLKRNAKVEVLGRQGDWCLIRYRRNPTDHDEAWVHGAYLRIAPEEL